MMRPYFVGFLGDLTNELGVFWVGMSGCRMGNILERAI